jgi:hypothetical protein
MPFKLIPPAGFAGDVTQGERAAEAVFAAHHTAPEIAKFGVAAVDHYARSKALCEAAGGRAQPCDPPTEEEQGLSEVFDLAWASALEVCGAVRNAVDWKCEVLAPDGVFVRVPGASIEVVQRAMKAARDVFAAAGVTPQEAALGQHEAQMHDIRGFQGPEPSDASGRAFGAFLDAEKAAIAAGGDIPNSYLLIEGLDTPYWRERLETSKVLNWKGEDEPATA